MTADILRGNDATLRDALKSRTAPLHDALDLALGEHALDENGYADFLARQYAARAPIERWAESQFSEALMPPSTSSLIAADLSDLGHRLPPEQTFAFPENGDPMGVAWALGGSALGNKTLLARRRRLGLAGPQRFLGDTRTAAFFARILPHLSRPVVADRADAGVAAAEAVFRTFLAAAARPAMSAAA